MIAKTRILAVAMVLAFYAADAQPSGTPAKERIEAMKIGFLTERLDLTPDEAKVFWPVYNKYSDELEALRKAHRSNVDAARKDFDELSEQEVEKLVDKEIAFRQQELDIMKKYHPQFKQVLPIKKVAKLYRAEENFKRKLLNMLQEKKQRRDNKDDPTN